MSIQDGGPAFPQPCTEGGYAANSPYNMAGGGISLRDWFAGMAIQGMLANGNIHGSMETAAFVIADNMIKASKMASPATP